MELDEAAAALLQTSTYALTEISDYERFIEIAERNTEIDVPAELAKLKNEAFSAPLQKAENPKQEEQTETPTVNAPEKITVTKNEPKSGVPYTYHFNANDVVTGGAKSKFKANVEAIQVLQKIEAENRYATPEEQSVMAKYAGWGGIPQSFTTDRAAESLGGNLGEAAPSGWKNEQKQLRELLTPEEYKAAVEVSMKKSVNETLDYYILSLNTISSIILCSIVSTLVFSQTCISLNAVGRGFCCRYCSSIS